MLQYDLTNTLLFDADALMPNEAEMFVFTAAILLAKNTRYVGCSLQLDTQSVEAVAKCIESRLSVFIDDVGQGERLRNRLKDFVGMRIEASPLCQMTGAGRNRETNLRD